MSENFCSYSGKRDETMVAYLYGELAGDERAAFDRHLITCAPCRAELDDLADVRSELSRWVPPDLAAHGPLPAAASRHQAIPLVAAARGRHVPVWAQAIAATVLLGVAAGIANLDVSYSAASGLSIRTGWQHVAATPAPPAAPAIAVQTSTEPTPWKTDLVALERELRAELDARPASVAAAASTTTGDEAMLRRVRQLLQDSERRQESELALRVAEVARELQAQRQADLIKIDRTLGLMQSRTGIEVMRTQRQVNSLAQQVSQRP